MVCKCTQPVPCRDSVAREFAVISHRAWYADPAFCMCVGDNPRSCATWYRGAVIYLDHNASTPVDPEVCRVIHNVLADPTLQANPSSVHVAGQRARAVVERARQQIARALAVGSLQVTITSGGTEANNLAILGCSRALRVKGEPCGVLTSPLEHPSVRAAAARLASEGVFVAEIEVDARGRIDPEAVAQRVAQHPEIGLVSLAKCNHEIGNLYPIEDIAAHVRRVRPQVIFHTDAVQAFGKCAIDFPALGVDLLSLSGHKVGGPKGVGALIHRRGISIQSVVVGGHQERGRRPGTECPALIAGLGVAATRAVEMREQRAAQIQRLRAHLLAGLDQLPDLVVNGDREQNVGNTVNFSVPGCEGQLVLINLDLAGIAVSTGAACSAGTLEPSHVLRALGMADERARGAIRVSLGPGNTAEDIDALLAALPRAIARVRAAG